MLRLYGSHTLVKRAFAEGELQASLGIRTAIM
jgi:hypothetical protein